MAALAALAALGVLVRAVAARWRTPCIWTADRHAIRVHARAWHFGRGFSNPDYFAGGGGGGGSHALADAHIFGATRSIVPFILNLIVL